MNESLTISKKSPERNSMNYAALRALGIERIQDLAGQLWTDYNSHDPGMTILEVLSYILTDLGYRVNYDIKDIIAQDLENGNYYDIKNFYTAGEILPNCPVTFDDYRKLIIDVDVYDSENADCEHVGVKNAWIEKAKNPAAEHRIYVDRKNNKLSLSPIEGVKVTPQNSYYVGVLYNILLEFDTCEAFGDLNSSKSESSIQLPDPAIRDTWITVDIRIDFKRWDEDGIDWEAPLNIASHIEQIRLRFPDRSSGAEIVLEGGLSYSNIVSQRGDLDFATPDFLNDIIGEIENLFAAYQLKVAKIFEIIDTVKRRLNSNRNLCEDFFKFNALKVEEILLCSDIELDAQADVETVEAEILHAISNFLSPKVYFYTLDEMLNKCRSAEQYPLAAISKNKSIITIDTKFREDVNSEDVITLLASDTNMGEYTVKCIRQNRENPNHTDIEVLETIASEVFAEGAYLMKGTIEEDRCLTVDQIFEGPKLRNGFIDDEELEQAKRKERIHVSDLIRIIMDVEGVVAVKNIQIANRPQDNDTNIESKSVKWCLDLAFEDNYVPRLNISDSKLTYYKDQLPFLADTTEVANLMDALEEKDRPQKRFQTSSNIPIPVTDIAEPIGSFKDLEDYISLQEDFPGVYGIGSEGIPGLSALEPDDRILREAQAKQLKGFLMFFDQLAANYLSQLNHVKDLFSMNGEKNEFGEYQIDKTYFSQPLLNPTATDDPLNFDPLYVDRSGHLVALQQIVEDKELYERRRNKFLDHLLGRFSESFTDYALLMYKSSGAKAGAELIEDKLKFLNAYPKLSASRGKAFDYKAPCDVWSIDNVSGLELRASLLTGMALKEAEDLVFRPHFKIVGTEGAYTFEISPFTSASILLKSPDGITYASIAETKLALERVVINGCFKDNYQIIPSPDNVGKFMFQLSCDGQLIGESNRTVFVQDTPGGDADIYIDNIINNVIKREFFENHESNRKNLSMPLNNYIKVNNIIANLEPPDNQPPQYEIDYDVFDKAFEFTNQNLVLSGTMIGAGSVGDDANTIIEKGEEALNNKLCELISYGIDRKQYTTINDTDSNLKFVLCNKQGVEIGRSIIKDFNKIITAELNQMESKIVMIGDLGEFEYRIVFTKGKELDVIIGLNLLPDVIGQQASFTQDFEIKTIDKEKRRIELNTNTRRGAARFYKGDTISIKDSDSNDGMYKIVAVEKGITTFIVLDQEIPTDDISGKLELTRSYTITRVGRNRIYVRGGEEEREIQSLISFFSEKFNTHEGLHLIEHTILRPRVKEPAFKPTDVKTLDKDISDLGELFFRKAVAIESVNTAQNAIIVSGDLTRDIKLKKIKIGGDSPNDGYYTHQGITFRDGKTKIVVKEKILFDLPAPGLSNGELSVFKNAKINRITPSSMKIRVSDIESMDIPADEMVAIWSPNKGKNDGRYKVAATNSIGEGLVEITLGEKENFIEDKLWPVKFDDEECDICNIIDPYSCIVSVVLPYWPSRFTDLDIRKYIEKTIRSEAPAHLLLNICWVDCEQMETFETQYKEWLLQISKKQIDKAQLSKALADFIDSISALRNVHPSGTLHSCDDDDTFEGSIILNNSVLGTF